jgi:ABC-2 type transport system permease protein
MNTWSYRRRIAVALRYLLLEQSRNRLALGILLVFVPLWYVIVGSIVAHDSVVFRFRAGSGFLSVDGHNLSLLTAGLNTITEVVAFTVFSSARAGLRFDRRLVLCGFPRSAAILAKLGAIAMVALVVALYATMTLLAFWQPLALALVLLGFLGAALAYGALGLLLGVLVSNELAGFFVIIMLSLIDTFLQNPIGNPTANKAIVEFFPSYGPTQIAVAGGFAHLMPWTELGLTLLWPLAFVAIAFVVFWWRTRIARNPTPRYDPQQMLAT